MKLAALTAVLSCAALVASDEAAPHNYALGGAPAYSSETSEWVRNSLRRAGLESEQASVVNLKPDSPGIPGAKDEEMLAFQQAIEQRGELAALHERAAGLSPPMPWLALGMYHRGMLGRAKLGKAAKSDWASERMKNGTDGTGMTIGNRLTALRNVGITPGMVVVDAGCGWGRLGRLLIEFLDPNRYFGIELDEFELRAFIQFELGLEHAALALEKRPVMLHSGAFRFDHVLGQHGIQADAIVFSSVLKSTMPIELRRIALCRAAHALKPNGTAIVFQDCDKEVRCLAAMTRGFEPLRQHHEGTKIAHEHVCLLRRTDAPAECALDARAESAKYCNNNTKGSHTISSFGSNSYKKILHHAIKNGSVKLSNTSLIRGGKPKIRSKTNSLPRPPPPPPIAAPTTTKRIKLDRAMIDGDYLAFLKQKVAQGFVLELDLDEP